MPDDLPKTLDKDYSSLKIIPTGPVSPAHKRDIALNYAKGQILAFIDDDAYPAPDWLKYAVENFKSQDVAAVAGPAITPKDDSLSQRASGEVYASFLVSGNLCYRYLPKNKREVVDYPSCNLLVRAKTMKDLGGFNTVFWPGEDTKLCLDITQKLKKKIIYDPNVLVWHHRRPVFIPHLKQIKNYALHRGYFVKRYPQTSLKISYFMPSILLIFVLLGGLGIVFLPALRIVYISGLILYMLTVFAFSLSSGLYLLHLVFPAIILTHFTYGVYFLRGLFSKKLREEL